jgi:flagellar hook assembly protein FlgD
VTPVAAPVVINEGNGNGNSPVKENPTTTIDTKGHEIDSALARQLGEELSKLAGSYWSEKINSYRVRIDRMMTSNDQATLNQLRVRWGIATADTSAHGMGDGLKMMANFSKGGMRTIDDDVMQDDIELKKRSDGTLVRVRKEVKITVDNGKADTVITETEEAVGADELADGHHGTVEIAVMSKDDGETNVAAKLNINGQELDQTQGLEMVMNMMVASGDERAIVVKSTKDMANRYRPQLDELKKTIFSDVAGFMGIVADHIDGFVQQHSDNIGSDKVAALATNIHKMREGFVSGELQEGLGMIYTLLGEPLLMLYNGSDIGDLVPASIAAPVPGMKMSGTTTLRQSFPNPASSKATISYTLNEASSATVLRLYDASGKVVGTYDQGAQSAGEHNATLDVSAITPGTYLYHLTVQTPKGEQVFSKTLQVAR